MSNGLEMILGGLVFPEAPRWRDGRLVFADMHANEVVAMRPDGARETIASFQGPISGLGWLPDGQLLVVSMNDRQLLSQGRNGKIANHADLSRFTRYPINDMVVDKHGRAYVGNFGFDFPKGEIAPTRVALVGVDGKVHEAASGLVFPNGMVLSPDGGSMIIAETLAARLTAFDIQGNGLLSGRRTWAQLPEHTTPDGICLDAEGAIWVASPITREILRVREHGAIAERIATDQMPTACMLGGADRRVLYVLSVPSADLDECRRMRAARVSAMTVDVPGVGSP
jgi:sugar lactone lactonase YvrE